jgi:hypothetical protein
MRTYNFKAILKAVVLVTGILLLGAGASVAQTVVNLTAAPTTATLPDGTIVPMWGYFCSGDTTGTHPTTAGACSALNSRAGAAWSPVVLTVPTGQNLQIYLTNNLSFIPTGTTTPNNIPTSLVIIGQLGGGLGNSPTLKDSPTHATQGATWPIAGDTNGATFNPPPQGQRVQSFSTEVASGATTALTWNAPRAGTYLIESGTHPSIQGPMGLYGMLVVTSAPTADTSGKETAAGTAYPGVTYDADVPLLLSEIDSLQNNAVTAAVSTVGFSETAARVLRDSVSSVSLTLDANGNVINAGTGYKPGDIVTISGGGFSVQATAIVGTVDGSGAITSITVTNPGKGYSSVPAASVTSGTGIGAQLTPALSLAGVMCSDSAAACYPPAVNYTPLYYLVNGAAFNKTNANASLFPLTPATLTPAGGAGTGSVLVRFVNAGLRMHVPAIVGSLTGVSAPIAGLSLIAEDGNPLPGVSRVQNEVFMAAGKTYDVLINGPAGGVSTVNITSAGAGYTSSVSAINYASGSLTVCASPTVTISPVDGLGSGATASLMMDSTGTTIAQINLLTVGAGYDAAPLVSVTDTNLSCSNPNISTTLAQLPVNFSGGGGTGASATATINGGAITAITVIKPGNGYTSAPAVIINDTPTPTTAALAVAVIKPGIGTFPVYDRELSLSANAIARDAGMLAYIGIDGGGTPASAALAGAKANPDTYNSVIAGQTLTVSDPAKGVIANDVNISGVQVVPGSVIGGTLTLNTNGTFTFAASAASGSFQYCGNGATSGLACTTVTLGAAPIEVATGIVCTSPTYNSTVATSLSIKSPGVLTSCKDAAGYPLTVALSAGNAPVPSGGLTLSVDQNGGFNASVAAPGPYNFTFKAQNSQGTLSASSATVTLNFPSPSNLQVTVLDGKDKTTQITDYRWIIEEDRTFYINPNCTANPPAAGCPTAASGIVPTFGTNFHVSYMPVVASGCTGALSCESGQTVVDPGTGAHNPAVCDVGNGVCRTTATQETPVDPKKVFLDPTKRYYITVLPGDAANPFIGANGSAPSNCAAGPNNPDGSLNTNCGHGIGGAPIAFGQTSVTILTQPTPFPPAKLSVFVFEDDFPLNGEHDAGGAVDVLASNEPGLGGFAITLFDDAGNSGDATGQPTYNMFNMPLSNSLAGTIDPTTGEDACPISVHAREGFDATTGVPNSPSGMTGLIQTCPKFEADGITLSPLAGQAVIDNLYPGRYGVVATPAADRIAKGEEWLQTNTLDGSKAHDSFLRIGEPSYFQEFGPAGYHVSIGFANPKIINDRKAGICGGTDPNLTAGNCGNTVTGMVTTERMSRTPDQRLYSSGDNSSFSFTQCYVSLGDADGEDFAFTKCNPDGTFSLTGIPDGTWRVTVFDQWNDMLVDGLSTPVGLSGGTTGATTNMGQIAMNQWQANLYARVFLDQNYTGVSQYDLTGTPCTGTNTPTGCNANYGNDLTPGLAQVVVNNRFRDGSFSNYNLTGADGRTSYNEVFPLFSWYVVEGDTTRYKSTGTHVVYDAGGPADGTCTPATAPCGSSTIGQFMANTSEQVSLPSNLRVPGAVYCDKADCTGFSIATGPIAGGSSGLGGSTGRIDPPWVQTEGWQGFSGQNSFLEFGMKPFAPGENGGIHGHVVYSSTRPFDDPQLLVQNKWEPQVPNVTMNLYQEGTAPDGTTSLKLIDTTQTSSFDAWAQGFRSDGIPNMNCPGQGRDTGTNADLFFFSLYNQPNFLDVYNNGAGATALPNNSQFKCYDGMHNWNQLQPAPYDGAYQFPSVTSLNPTSGMPAGTNCHLATTKEPWGCVSDPDATDPYRFNTPMLPIGKYVVEVVVPPGYELVKEEDKNILIGDNYIAPVTQQFAGLGNIFIIPDQAAVAGTNNPNNPQNPTRSLGTAAVGGIDASRTENEAWPCVGATRIVPDYISLFPQSAEVSPFAGATRNLCDRKEVTLQDQASALARFFIFTSTHVASHFTGVITDDFTSEFDPFSPQFGEKFSPANLPISIKDWAGNEISRVYSDHWGTYNGLTYSTWEVNPPNPTGYAPQMMVTCMNDPGTGVTPDPLYNPQYSQFCYEIPFMPGNTQYMDTPVIPTSAFAGAGYNNPDCAYPDATPAISEVDGDGIGPWVSETGHTLTIHALGNQTVTNYGYSGPSATTAPFNQKTVTRHYGFGNTRGSGGVTIGGVTVPGGSITWSDTTLSFPVPANVPVCPLQQQVQYGGPDGEILPLARCGELVVTAGNGKQSIDAVTVTVGGKAPTRVPTDQPTIQTAIDTAKPGDLIIVTPGTYNEILLMWKPVRLQGVGAASSVINANTHPAGKLDPWRAQVNCLFGLALNGQPFNPTTNPSPLLNGGKPNPYDSTGALSCPGNGWFGFENGPNNPQVDRLPLEGTLGWDTTVNGNLAELLQEPSLMGAYEGAGITVLAKGVRFPVGVEVFGNNPDNGTVATESQMPLGTVLLTSADCATSSTDPTNPFPSNFHCNPSSIDGLSITNSSQGGGGVFVHAWAHHLEIANNRIYNNAGTMSGGISVGQGESPDALLTGNGGDPLAPLGGFDQQPWTCVPGSINPDGSQNANPPGFLTNQQLPYCYNLNVNVHHNSVTSNSSIGDELFSATPAGAGGVTFCTGADNYMFNYNWLCGNLSTGDGGGLVQLGFSRNGDIEHNAILFNQSTNPTIPTNGGGIIIMGTGPDGTTGAVECGSVTDIDCAPGLGDGTGPGLVINANLVMGNAAESGSGGGIRFQGINGTEIIRFPSTPNQWYGITVTNNIIANNVAGWDGAGVSLQDAVNVDLINNTIISNDTTASSGVLFNTLGAPLASSTGNNCIQTGGTTASCPQPAGLVTTRHSTPLNSALSVAGSATITCPAGHFTDNAPGGVGGNCVTYSVPRLYNDLFWQNRSYYIGVSGLGAGTLNQQHLVALFNASGTPAASQPQADAVTANGTGGGVIVTGGTGACVSASYWDLGVRGDTAPNTHNSGLTLVPEASVLTNTTGYPGGGVGFRGNTNSNPTVVRQYCNGSRVPPENGGLGYQVPPGISDATVPNPVFNLTPAATVDEGNNWININWGPLAMENPVNGSLLGNYGPAAGSPVISYITPLNSPTTYAAAPARDFYGRLRKTDGAVDVGAVEFVSSASFTIAPDSLSFTSSVGVTSAAQTVTVTNTGNTILSFTTGGTGANFAAVPVPANSCTGVPAGSSCIISVTFTPVAGATTTRTATLTITGAGAGSQTVLLTGTVLVPTYTVTPSSLTFNSPLNVQSAGQTVTIKNTSPAGGASLVVSSTALAGTNPNQFARTPTCAATLAPGASCLMTVTFTPTSVATPKTAVLNVNVPAPAAPTQTQVTLTGNVLAPSYTVTWTGAPGALAFGNQLIGTTGTAGVVTITNTSGAGGAPLTVNAPTKGGANANQWTAVTNNCPASLVATPGSNTCTMTIAFSPTTVGAKTANLNVNVAAPAAPTQTPVPLTGTGAQAAVSFTLPTLTTSAADRTAKFGVATITNSSSVATGYPLTLTTASPVAVVRDSGTGTFTLGFSVSHPQPAGTTLCSTGLALAPGSACVVGVNYAPPGAPGSVASTGHLTTTDTGIASGGAQATQSSGTLTGN